MRIAGILILLLIAPPTFAESPELVLKDLIEEGLQKNAALKAAKAEALSKEAEAGPKSSYEDPMLAFEAMNYPVDTFSNTETGMTGNQLSLTQRVPFPGKLGKLWL